MSGGLFVGSKSTNAPGRQYARRSGHGCADPDTLPPAPRFAAQVDLAELAAWTERNKASREAYYLRPFADQRLH